jgi:O-antigen ligase
MSGVGRVENTLASTGLLPWVWPAMLSVGAVQVLLSDRNLAESFLALQVVAEPPRPGLAVWWQRAVSLLLLVAAVEQVASHAALRRPVPSPMLLAAFLLYWVGTIGLPSVFGAHSSFSHELLYAPTFGVACCLAMPQEQARMVRLARDSLMVLMLAGLAGLVVRPAMVADMSYAAGLLPGVPRFAGLTAHPVTQGLLAQVALLLVWAAPYRHRGLRLASWGLALGVLLIAQSKAAWIACAVCGLAMLAWRHGPQGWIRLADPQRPQAGLLAWSLAGIAVLGLAIGLLMGDLAREVAHYLDSPDGAQWTSLTGRDRIWAVAAEEWRSHPVFGYGPTLWDAAYRASIGLPHATHAHNQLMDDAARAGTVGVLALALYASALTVLAWRAGRATAALSVGLLLALALRAISEVPLLLLGYGTDLFTHGLLLATLAAAAAPSDSQVRA